MTFDEQDVRSDSIVESEMASVPLLLDLYRAHVMWAWSPATGGHRLRPGVRGEGQGALRAAQWPILHRLPVPRVQRGARHLERGGGGLRRPQEHSMTRMKEKETHNV